MDKIRIAGGRPLSGEVVISGAKNSALPCIAAALLTPDTVHLDNVPRLVKDVATMRLLLEHLGCDTMWEGNRLSIQARNVDLFEAPYDMVKTMRASVLVLGPLVARFGKAVVSMPGGCAIGARPIDLHLAGLEALGARLRIEHGYVLASAPKLTGAHYRFANVTVTGTENLVLAASLAEGETILENCAMEPEVEDVIRLVRSMGAQIEGDNTDTLRILGVQALHGTTHSVIPDRIETGTFLLAAAVTGGHITVKRSVPQHLHAALEKLRDNGCRIETGDDLITIEAPSQLQPSDVETRPYPHFPTDLQAQYMAVMTQAEGTTNIYENIFENRFMHVAELRRMGARITTRGHVAHVHGKTRLSGASVMATDLRASASLLIGGLVAEGITMLQRVYHIDRGYERIEEKLRGLGADVERIS
jgi:UDP-N-acetylglucosamine 1-carboxyvinyltransferase